MRVYTNAGVAVSKPCGINNVRANFGTGSTVPQAVCVPTLAYDQNSIILAWNKPDNYSSIVDYNVYMNGEKLGNASSNANQHSVVKPYFDSFYNDDVDNFHVKTTFHSFRVTGLEPNKKYKFTVRSVDVNGKESEESNVVVAKTATIYKQIVNITCAGAVGDGVTLNTAAIQNAIDSCSNGSKSAYGCKVLIPANSSTGNVFVTGALFLKSNMTLEIAKGAILKGSIISSDYPLSKGYQLYSYFMNSIDDRRPPSLLNTLTEDYRNGPIAMADHQGYDDTRGSFVNIRVVGKGTIDGSGWLRNKTDLTDEAGNNLAQFDKSNNTNWSTLGLLAKSQLDAATAEAGGTLNTTQNTQYYSFRRSSLTTFRGVNNFYFGDLNLTNPALHGPMFLECENVVFANTKSETYDINNADGVEFGNTGQGKNYETGKNPTQYFWAFNNYLREGHGVLAMGSHVSAGIEDILAEDNVSFLSDNGLYILSTPPTGDGVSSSNVSGSYPETNNINVTFISINITNAPPSKISHLQDSLFKHIIVTNWAMLLRHGQSVTLLV
uniref:Fibronectin type-III domain-containing protein n=1 Tax=Ditylenchus dipsaci TaxID=166011 RepID=A0A915CZV2_9BILA